MTEQSQHHNTRRILRGCVLLAIGAAAGFAYGRLFVAAPEQTPEAASANHAEHTAHAPPAVAPKVLYWYDPMKPDQHFDKPGRSPFMDMDLVPRYADAETAAASQGVKIDARLTQNLGLRTIEVKLGRLVSAITAVGEFQYNQRDVATVQARADGFVERVYDRAPGDSIARGAPLVDVLLPSWGSAQQEFLSVLALADPRLVDAGRSRLRLLGMSEALIASVERQARPQAVITLRSPLAGVIVALDVRSGMSITAGTTLAIINASDPVWLEVAVPERSASGLRVGAELRAELAAYPGSVFTGKVASILPTADSTTRSVRLRVSFANADGRLRPGLSARVQLDAPLGDEVVLVPSTAVIRGGHQNRVMKVEDGGRYTPSVVQLGREADGQIEVLHGLRAGERVAAAAQFLLDAEASLQGLIPFEPSAMPMERAP